MHLMSASIVPSSIRFPIPSSLPHYCPPTSPPFHRHSPASSSRLFPLCANKPRPWWQRLFSDDPAADRYWFDWGADYVQEPAAAPPLDDDDDADDDAKFQAWKTRAEAISELREAQEDARNAQGREWEDWLETDSSASSPSEQQDCDWADTTMESSTTRMTGGGDPQDAARPDDSLLGAIKGLILGSDDDELLFEDRVFRFASRSSAKFIFLLVLVPWALDFLVHDYMMMPFLDRYVKKVPLAAELLDVRRHQKLEMVKALKVEKARFRLEVEIGKSPPLSDEEIWLELRQKAIELRDEWRLENRRAFANIWSDTVYGIALFALIYFNKSKVALLKFTGYKVLYNVSDTGKAFLIILITDIFLGYHSESGWQVLTEIILEHYGLEVDQAAITIFICTVPVVLDACVKLWLFKFLPKLSPNVANIFQEMKRH